MKDFTPVNDYWSNFTYDKTTFRQISISVNGTTMVSSSLHELYQIWEETSYRLELRQASPKCVQEEFNNMNKRTGPKYRLSFDPHTSLKPMKRLKSGKVIIIIFNMNENTVCYTVLAFSSKSCGYQRRRFQW